MKSSIAIAALVAASIGLAVPVIAQSAPSSIASQVSADASSTPPAPPADSSQMAPNAGAPHAGMHKGMAHRGMGGAGALLALACSPKGAEALDVTLVRLSYRLDLTADQKPLFDTFRDKAMAAQSSFAEACKADMPTADAGAKPDFLTRIKASLTLDQARLTAIDDVLPSFEALYTTLTDAQKGAFMPERGMGNHPKWGGMQHAGGMGRHQPI